jgi:hypothetical protein
MSIGAATKNFVVQTCTSGWSQENGGIGLYTDGQLFTMGSSYHGEGKAVDRRYSLGDRIGFELIVSYILSIIYAH